MSEGQINVIALYVCIDIETKGPSKKGLRAEFGQRAIWGGLFYT